MTNGKIYISERTYLCECVCGRTTANTDISPDDDLCGAAVSPQG